MRPRLATELKSLAVSTNALAHVGRDGRLIEQGRQPVARDETATREFAREDDVPAEIRTGPQK